jgi:hypothetical protein
MRNTDFFKLEDGGRIRLKVGQELSMEGLVGSVQLADGAFLDSSMWHLVSSDRSSGRDGCGSFDLFEATYQAPHELGVKATYKSYHERPVLSVQMTVANAGSNDVHLGTIGALCCEPPNGVVDAGFRNPTACRVLDQVFYWTGHKELHDYLRPLARERRCAYWSTVVSEPGGRSLVVGIGGPATGRTEIRLWHADGKMGFELCSVLYASVDRQRRLRIPPGGNHATEPVLLAMGNDTWQALSDYADFTCQLLDWRLQHPPYAGIFSAYGSDPNNGDPAATPLTEKRIMDELIPVADTYLSPYGLDTIKTQFRGLSSSGFTERIGAAEAPTPAAAKLVDTIRRNAWCGDGVSQDFPRGIPWHIRQLKSKGYRPALVCRPFLNVKAGTPELDKVAADLFEMTVKEWGYEYLMFDFISVDYESETDTMTVEEGIHRRFKAIRDRLGPEVFIEACMVWPGPVLGIADGFRPGHDWRGGLEHELMQIFASRYYYHGRFFQLDNEFFDPALQPFTWGAQGAEGMQASLDRVRMWVSFCGLLGMSFLGGAALERVSPERWHLFQRALPAVGGNARPLDLMTCSPPGSWRRDVQTPAGSFAVLGLFNYDEERSINRVVRPYEWGLTDGGMHLFFDFWTGDVYGPAYDLTLSISPFSCRILFVQPVPSQPALVGSTRHVTGGVGIEQWSFDQKSKTLEATTAGAPNSEERYYIWLPGNEGVAECRGAIFEIERPRLIRLTVHFGPTGRAEWSLRLDEHIIVP